MEQSVLSSWDKCPAGILSELLTGIDFFPGGEMPQGFLCTDACGQFVTSITCTASYVWAPSISRAYTSIKCISLYHSDTASCPLSKTHRKLSA
jgi:hypothetical protein